MKTVKQLFFTLDKDNEHMPYAFISFNPSNLRELDKEVLIYNTKHDLDTNNGFISYIGQIMLENIFEYKCKAIY